MKKWKLVAIMVLFCIVAFFGIKYHGFDPSLIGYDYCVATGNRVFVLIDEMGESWSECHTPDGKVFYVDCNKFPRICV